MPGPQKVLADWANPAISTRTAQDVGDDWSAPEWQPPAAPKARTLYENFSEAPKPLTDWAHKNAEELNNSATEEGWGSTLKGFAAGAHEGAARLFSPMNILGAAADIPAVGELAPMGVAAVRGLIGATQAAHGAATATGATSWKDRAMGLAEGAMGALGLRGAWRGLTGAAEAAGGAASTPASTTGERPRIPPGQTAGDYAPTVRTKQPYVSQDAGTEVRTAAGKPPTFKPAPYTEANAQPVTPVRAAYSKPAVYTESNWADPNVPASTAPITAADQVSGIDPARVAYRSTVPGRVGSRVPTTGTGGAVEGPAEAFDIGVARPPARVSARLPTGEGASVEGPAEPFEAIGMRPVGRVGSRVTNTGAGATVEGPAESFDTGLPRPVGRVGARLPTTGTGATVEGPAEPFDTGLPRPVGRVGARLPAGPGAAVEGPAEPLTSGAPRTQQELLQSMGLQPRVRAGGIPSNAPEPVSANPAPAEKLDLTEFPNTTGTQQHLPQELPEVSGRGTGPSPADLLPPAETVSPLPEVATHVPQRLDVGGEAPTELDKLRSTLADMGLVPRKSPLSLGNGTAESLDSPIAPFPGNRRVLPRVEGQAPIPSTVRDQIHALYDTLSPKLAASKQALSDRLGVGVDTERFPPGGYDESKADFTKRVLTADPKSLFGAERKLRAAVEPPAAKAAAPAPKPAPPPPPPRPPLYDESGRPAMKVGKPRGKPGGRAKSDPELGAASTQALASLAGGLAGGGIGAATAEKGDKLKGGLEGAAAGAFLPWAIAHPETAKALRAFGLFGSPVTVAKKFLGDTTNVLSEAAIRTMSGEGGGGTLLNKVFNKQLFNRIGEHFNSEQAPDETFATSAPELPAWMQKITRLPTRALGAVTEGFQDQLHSAGAGDQAARLTAVDDPHSALGRGALDFQRKGGTLAQLAMPVARVPINMAEMGMEAMPGLGYGKLATAALRGEPTESSDWWRATAKQILGAGAGGYGVYRGMTDKADSGAPATVAEKLGRAALGGYMTLPESVGEGVGRALSKHAKPGTSVWGRAATGAKDALVKNLPLPTGIDFNPLQWAAQFAPTGLTTAGQMLGGPAATELQQPDILDPLVARIPGLNLILPRKKPAKR